MTKRILGFVAAVLVVTGVAQAAVSWREYRADLIRCADAVSACGSSYLGTNTLNSGSVSARSDRITVTLKGAATNTNYRLAFLQLVNSGSDTNGPYTGVPYDIGPFATDARGNANLTFRTTVLGGAPKLGYFLVYRPGIANEFVTGVDQYWSSLSE